jgi:hypothetical protein
MQILLDPRDPSAPKRIVFERGLTLWACDGKWCTHVGTKSGPIPVDALAVAQQFRPLVATYGRDERVATHFVLDHDGRLAPRPDAMRLFDRLFLQAAPIDYLAGAIVHHVAQLADRYEAIRDSYKELTLIPGREASKVGYYSAHPEPYYEFDAVTAAIRRAYDACRYPLWSCFGSGGTIPRSFSRTVPHCAGLSQPIREYLMGSWQKWGVAVTEYRDCIQHYVPVDFALAAIFMQEEFSGVWSALARIPENPNAKSKRDFIFTQGLDALSFASVAACEVLGVMRVVVDAAVNHYAEFV